MDIVNRLKILEEKHEKTEREVKKLFEDKVISKNLRYYLDYFNELTTYGKIAIAWVEAGIMKEVPGALMRSKTSLEGVSVSLLGIIGTEAEKKEGNLISYTGPILAKSLNRVELMRPLFEWAEKTYNEYEEKVINIIQSQQEAAKNN